MLSIASWGEAGLCGIRLEGVQKSLDINFAVQRCRRRLYVTRLTGLGRERCMVGGRLGSGHNERCRGLGDGYVRHAMRRASVLWCGHIWDCVTCTCLMRGGLAFRHGRSSLGRDFLAWCCPAYAFVLRRIWVLPGAGAQFCVVHGRVGHVNFGLVEANIHHIIKDWDVGWRWEVQRLGRRGRQQGYFATQLRFVGVVSRCHVWIRQGAEGAAREEEMGATGVL